MWIHHYLFGAMRIMRIGELFLSKIIRNSHRVVQKRNKYGTGKGFSFVCVGPCSGSFTKAVALVLAFNGELHLDIRGRARSET